MRRIDIPLPYKALSIITVTSFGVTSCVLPQQRHTIPSEGTKEPQTETTRLPTPTRFTNPPTLTPDTNPPWPFNFTPEPTEDLVVDQICESDVEIAQCVKGEKGTVVELVNPYIHSIAEISMGPNENAYIAILGTRTSDGTQILATIDNADALFNNLKKNDQLGQRVLEEVIPEASGKVYSPDTRPFDSLTAQITIPQVTIKDTDLAIPNLTLTQYSFEGKSIITPKDPFIDCASNQPSMQLLCIVRESIVNELDKFKR